jgi:hypothetical protein
MKLAQTSDTSLFSAAYLTYKFNLNTVAYLCHARTETLKHAPTITQQWTKLCFLRAKLG